MSKKIIAMPASEILIQFNDKEYVATFNMMAVGYMQEELLWSSASSVSTLGFGALILYGAIKANDPEFTLDEANAIALTIRPQDLSEIINEYVESVGSSEMMEESKKKIMMQMLLNLRR